jgi:transcriptional regulator with XRE-family HTH domain
MLGYGNRMRTLRLENKLTMDQAAKIVGIAKSSYAGYESEFRNPSLEKLMTFANYYNVSVDFLLGVTDCRERNQMNKNARELLNGEDLHWDGMLLSEAELKLIKTLMSNSFDSNKDVTKKEKKI